MGFSSSFHKCKKSGEILVHSKAYHSKFIVIIFVNLPHEVHFNNLCSTNIYTPPYIK
jgi:hypothetical protein